MRVKIGSQIRSHQGYLWRVTHINQRDGLVELVNEEGIKFHIPRLHLRSHGKKMGFIARWRLSRCKK